MSFKHTLIFFLIITTSVNIKASEINSLIYASWNKPDVELLYKLPEIINNDTKVLFIIHGGYRDPKRYIQPWLEKTNNKNVILIAPKFTREYYPNYVFLEKSDKNGNLVQDESKTLINSISSFYTLFKSKYNLSDNNYMIFGYSGGSQFVHRYMMYSLDKNIDKAVIGGAPYYTFLNDASFPYGVKNMPLSRERYEWLLSRELLFLQGDKDIKPNYVNNESVQQQGSNRFSRGNAYFKNLVTFAETNNMPFRWRYKVIEGAEHKMELFVDEAHAFLLSELDY